MDNRFAGKVAIVTGSSSGIGKATALQMAREGAAVCVVADRNVAGGQATVDEIRGAGGSAVFIQADVSSGADCERVVTAAASELGGLDILANNAGITRRAALEEMDENFWDTVLNTDLKSAYLMSRAAAPEIIKRGSGAIVNVSSVHAEQTHPRFAAYAASKAGLCGLTRALALELAPCGVRVNCILPGTIDVSLFPRKGEAPNRSAWSPRTDPVQIMGRLGSPDEIAAAICFLASDEASFVNGATLVADGGLLCTLGDGM